MTLNNKHYPECNEIIAFDILRNPIKPGDIVAFNNNYLSTIYIGKVSHLTKSGNLVIFYPINPYSYTYRAYRYPEKVVKVNGSKIEIDEIWNNTHKESS